jgi:Fur family transcriptional regulator, ferric uptake regulator
MTDSPDVRAQPFAELEDAVRALRRAGLRISTPRRLVLEALYSADGPLSAAFLARRLSLEESSVYRNLEVLEQRGVVRHVHLGHSPGLYVLAREQEAEYLYCERCARVTPVTPAALDSIRASIKKRFGYTPRFTHFAIVGLCERCARRPPTDAPTGARQRSGERATPTAASSRRSGSHLHSHGDHVHSHPHGGQHTH